MCVTVCVGQRLSVSTAKTSIPRDHSIISALVDSVDTGYRDTVGGKHNLVYSTVLYTVQCTVQFTVQFTVQYCTKVRIHVLYSKFIQYYGTVQYSTQYSTGTVGQLRE